MCQTHLSWNCKNPGLTWGLAFSREVVARGEVAGRLGMEAGSWGMEPANCFQASMEGEEPKAPAVVMVVTSMEGAVTMETGAEGWELGPSLSSLESLKGGSDFTFRVARKWKLTTHKGNVRALPEATKINWHILFKSSNKTVCTRLRSEFSNAQHGSHCHIPTTV